MFVCLYFFYLSLLFFIDALFNLIFPITLFSPSLIYSQKFNENIIDFDKVGCIINDPDFNMKIPLVDFDVNLNVDRLIEGAKMTPDRRDKPLFAIVRGMGGGKTRAFEEIRRETFRRKGCLPIAITFNCDWLITSDEIIEFQNKTASNKMSFLLAVFVRVASIFYDISFSEAYDTVLDSPIFDQLLKHYKSRPMFLIPDFITYMLGICNRTDIDTIIFLVDEIVRVTEQFDKGNDIASSLREGLLSKPILLPSGKQLNVTLAMSSLYYSPTGLTKSDRVIRPVKLATELNKKDVVHKIMLANGEVNASESDIFILELLVLTANRVPRILEIMTRYIISKLVIIDNKRHFVLDIVDFMNNVSSSVSDKYPSSTEIDDEIGARLVYQSRIAFVPKIKHSLSVFDKKISEDMSEAVSDSIGGFINDNQISISRQVIFPSIFLLLLLHDDASDFSKVLKIAVTNIIDNIKTFCAVKLDQKKIQLGVWLEIVYYEWLYVRLMAFKILQKNSVISIANVFGIGEELFPDDEISNLNISKYTIEKISIDQKSLNSYKNLKYVTNQLSLISGRFLNRKSICIFMSAKDEAWDIGLKIITPGQKPHYIFIDNKSIESKNNIIDIHQYQHVKTKVGPKLDGDWSYIYATTADLESFGYDKVTIIGRKDTMAMLGACGPLYYAIRQGIVELKKKQETTVVII